MMMMLPGTMNRKKCSWMATTLWLLLYESLVLAQEPKTSTLSHTPTLTSGLLASIAIVTGLVVCLFGYKWFRPTAFFCGFLAGGIGSVAIVDSVWKHTLIAVWLGFAMGGLVVGSLLLILHNAGVCVVGTCAGVFLGFSLDALLQKKYYPGHGHLYLIILVSALGFFGAILAYKLQKPFVIVATSLIGAELVVYGIGYFVGVRPMQNAYRIGWLFHIPTSSWYYLAAVVSLWCLGMLVQFQTNRMSRIEKHYRDSLAVESVV